ncbi:undecaprenyl-phosphate glucose phosphotransferase [Alkalihalobacillus sp. MEB130]|uniref:undecaprenyl-phosphate glucose phosphotransferase n=1 Tax=Alkalihalobacillus sp. MEB130 TaxID=2976704 RepID=UPI0028DEB8FB|nr:undecaprenyl-phosphate glucose phosphotransferase [Alkalihalobacillus sp. MEB130]MDT8860327.1 undecaprenyl-phosphate glucose phosphotransferase [Alkalihalobacillus sp. MEB130]
MIRGNERFLTQIYTLCDILAIQLAFVVAWWLKFNSVFASGVPRLSTSTYYLWGVIFTIIAIILGYIMTLYQPKRKKRFTYELFRVSQVQVFSMFVLLSLLFVFNAVHVSRSFLFIFLLTSIVIVGIYRYFVKVGLRYFRKKGFNKQFVLILGAGSVGRYFSDNLQHQPEMGLEVIGFLDDNISEHQPEFSHYKPIRGKLDDLEEILNNKLIDEVVLALPLSAHEKYKEIINICDKAGVRLLIIPDYYDVLPAKFTVDQLADIPLINVRDVPLDELRNQIAKRAFDIVFSIMAIIITSPILIGIAFTIKLTSKGPIIFKQERVGLNRRTFIMYKFRSMIDMPQNVSNSKWTTENDPRKTKFGTFLRKTSLDELPQFFNVLKGDMSVVGPRPERVYFVEQFKEEIPKYMVKHHVRPGITGWAQVNGLRGDTSIFKRVQLDLFYIENWTFLLDIKIVCKTVINGFINKNAY